MGKCNIGYIFEHLYKGLVDLYYCFILILIGKYCYHSYKYLYVKLSNEAKNYNL